MEMKEDTRLVNVDVLESLMEQKIQKITSIEPAYLEDSSCGVYVQAVVDERKCRIAIVCTDVADSGRYVRYIRSLCEDNIPCHVMLIYQSDPFSHGYAVYHIVSRCKQFPEIKMDDVKTWILNTNFTDGNADPVVLDYLKSFRVNP